jgi:ACS family tartrate transporter-like MFS transporter
MSATESSILPDTAIDAGARARRRIARRLIPYLFFLYIIAYLDRVNVGFAALQMTGELGFSPAVFGFGAGIFFVGYFLFEIPGSVLVETWSARKWIARIMISWGVIAVAMGFIQTATQFYWLRFALGAAEAGFFPGLLVYLSHWFRQEDRAKAVALFMAAVPISNIIGAPISGLLLEVNWWGHAGWRWLYIIEGLPAVIFGVVTLFYLTDRPHQAKWLPEDERAWLTAELDRERAAKEEQGSNSFWKSIAHRDVWLLALAYFGMVCGLYGFNLWLPTIVKQLSGLSNFTSIMLTAIPACVGLVAMLLIGWSSDRSGERRWHAAIPMAVGGLGLLCGALLQQHVIVAIALFCVGAIGIFGHFPSFWATVYSRYTGVAAAAIIALINSLGNLGGFAGPFVIGYLNNASGTFVGGILYLAGCAIVASGCILALKPNVHRERGT